METLKDWLKPELIWFLLGLVMLLIEFVVPGLIIFFFGIGAFIVALICFITDISLNMQLTIFLLSSVVLLLSLRKWLKNIFVGQVSPKESPDDLLKEFVGKKAIVIREITPDTEGKVEFRGTSWNAEASEVISEGSAVSIIGKTNITLKVKSLKRG